MVKKLNKDPGLYTGTVNKAQLFYLDNLLLSISGNKLYIHNISLPEPGDKTDTGHYRQGKLILIIK